MDKRRVLVFVVLAGVAVAVALLRSGPSFAKGDCLQVFEQRQGGGFVSVEMKEVRCGSDQADRRVVDVVDDGQCPEGSRLYRVEGDDLCLGAV